MTEEAMAEHPLPKWFATKGPSPYWLAEHWSLALSLSSILVVLLNSLLTINWINASTTVEKWINAGAALIAALGLFLKDRESTIYKVATWREQVRAEEAGEQLNDHAAPLGTIPPPDDGVPGKHHQ